MKIFFALFFCAMQLQAQAEVLPVSVVNATTDYTLPTVPPVTVTWNDPNTGGVTGYRIYRSMTHSKPVGVYATVPVGTDQFIDPYVQVNTEYTYWVAPNGSGEAVATYDNVVTQLSTPSGLHSTARGDSVCWDWDDNPAPMFGDTTLWINYLVYGQNHDVVGTGWYGYEAITHNSEYWRRKRGGVQVAAFTTYAVFATGTTYGHAFLQAVSLPARSITATAAAVEPPVVAPAEFRLEQNYPNPFNPTTTIAYALQVKGKVRLSVYDLMGKEVAVLVDGIQSAGNHEVRFSGENLTSGVYYCKLQAAEQVITRKMMLLK